MRWFGWFRNREFPLPKGERHMSLEEIYKYWAQVPAKYRAECEWYLYRMDPAKAPQRSMLKFKFTQEQVDRDKKAFGCIPPDEDTMRYLAIDALSPSGDWWAKQEDPGMERRCYFLIRIMRRWRIRGAERHEEICVAGFDLVPDHFPLLASSRTGKMI